MKVQVIKNVLEANALIAEKNREVFRKAGVLALNFISSPGSGKTTLIEKTLVALQPEKAAVIVGDLETTRDAERVKPYAADVVQINTGMSCHLYANQVSASLKTMQLAGLDYVFIENVGNMVCPGEFDLGENLKVILYSLPEGDDKVAKYPTVFRAADIVLLTKMDLQPVLTFDMKRIEKDLCRLNEHVPLVRISATQGSGMAEWLQWLKTQRKAGLDKRARAVKE